MSSLTIWFTGLSSAGKSTLSEAVAEWVRGRGYSVELLDLVWSKNWICLNLKDGRGMSALFREIGPNRT